MLVKPIIINERYIRKISPLKINRPKLGNLSVEMNEKINEYNRFTTEIYTSDGNILGNEVFSLDTLTKVMEGFWLNVKPEYRNQGYRFGELLRLVSIIAMLENNMKKMEIYSKESAVYFHSKYKFVPNISIFEQRNKGLKDVANNQNSEFSNYQIGAERILRHIERTKEPDSQRKLCQTSNLLLQGFIRKVLNTGNEEYKKYPFSYGMSMCLYRDNIIQNKEFFNSLFKKHGIDYVI